MNILTPNKAEYNSKNCEHDKMKLISEYVKIFSNSKILLRGKNYTQAIENFNECVTISNKLNDGVKNIQAGYYLSISYFNADMFYECLENLMKCSEIIENYKNLGENNNNLEEETTFPYIKMRTKIFGKIFITHLILNNLDSAGECLKEIINGMKTIEVDLVKKLTILIEFLKQIFIRGDKLLNTSSTFSCFFAELECIRNEIIFNDEKFINFKLKNQLNSILSTKNKQNLFKFLNLKFFQANYTYMDISTRIHVNNFQNTNSNLQIIEKIVSFLEKTIYDSVSGTGTGTGKINKNTNKLKSIFDTFLKNNKIQIFEKNNPSNYSLHPSGKNIFNTEKLILQYKSRCEEFEIFFRKMQNIFDSVFAKFLPNMNPYLSPEKKSENNFSYKSPSLPSINTNSSIKVNSTIRSTSRVNTKTIDNDTFFKKIAENTPMPSDNFHKISLEGGNKRSNSVVNSTFKAFKEPLSVSDKKLEGGSMINRTNLLKIK
jgi:hypothetical protein